VAHTVITIDGETILDDPLDTWQRRPPELLASMISPGHDPKPYTKAMMIALADAAAHQQPIHINIQTSRHGAWTLTVTPTLALP